MAQANESPPAVVLMGGGSGASNLLKELKAVTPDITAIVTTFDSGGSSGILRARYDLPAPGDVRRCLAALGNNEQQCALFNKRLSNGHAVGNLVLCGLAQRHGSFDRAVQIAAEVLGITGRVLPVSSDASAELVMRHGGEYIKGEYNIGTFPITDPSAHVYLEPEAELHPDAAAAIGRADLVVISPGSLFTSLAAVLAPKGVKKALQDSKAALVSVANLRAEKPHTPESWHVVDHVRALEEYTGRPFDTVLYHKGEAPPGIQPLNFDPSRFDEIQAVAIGTRMAIDNGGAIIHDARAVAGQISQLLAGRSQ